MAERASVATIANAVDLPVAATASVSTPDPMLRRPRLHALLSEGGPVTVVGAPLGFGKSVLLTQWMQEMRDAGHQVVAVDAELCGHSEAVFCTELSAKVPGAAKGRARSARPSLAGVADGLRKMGQPVWLVVDGFDHVDDAHIVNSLATLVGNVEQLSLLVVGRSVQRMVTAVQSHIPVTHVGERELAFTQDETALLLASTGAHVSRAGSVAVHHEVMGWPMPLGVLALDLADTPFASDLAALSAAAMTRARRHLELAIGEKNFMRAGPLALVEVLGLDVVEVVSPTSAMSIDTGAGPSEPGTVAVLERNGLLSARHDDALVLEWSPLMRAVIRDDFVRRHPDEASTLEGALAQWYADRHSPERALIHAVNARRWDIFTRLVGFHPMALYGTQWAELMRAFAEVPDDAIVPDTTAAALRTITLQLPLDTQTIPQPRVLTAAEIKSISHSPHVRNVIERNLWLLALYRDRSMWTCASVCNENVRALMQAALATRTPEVVGLRSLSLVQSAALHDLLGDSSSAVVEYSSAYSLAPTSDFAFLGHDAAGHLALSNAVLGNVRAATTWLERDAVGPGADVLASADLDCAGTIARALIALRRIEAQPCADALADLDQLTGPNELWPFAAYARACHALVWGDRLNAIDELHSTWVPADLLAVSDANGGMAGPMLAAAQAELLMSLGRGNHAKAVLDGVRHHHPLVSVARARLALLTGDNGGAIAVANAVPRSVAAAHSDPHDRHHRVVHSPASASGAPSVSPLHRLETTIISAVAYQRLEMTALAADLLRRAVNQAEQLGTWLPLAAAPRSDLAAIATKVPSAAALLDSELFAGAPEIYPEAMTLVTLTERERVILERLHSGDQLKKIASSEYVSTNTVKTQLRTLYLKLGVTSREQALMVAGELQLLSPGAAENYPCSRAQTPTPA